MEYFYSRTLKYIYIFFENIKKKLGFWLVEYFYSRAMKFSHPDCLNILLLNGGIFSSWVLEYQIIERSGFWVVEFFFCSWTLEYSNPNCWHFRLLSGEKFMSWVMKYSVHSALNEIFRFEFFCYIHFVNVKTFRIIGSKFLYSVPDYWKKKIFGPCVESFDSRVLQYSDLHWWKNWSLRIWILDFVVSEYLNL